MDEDESGVNSFEIKMEDDVQKKVSAERLQNSIFRVQSSPDSGPSILFGTLLFVRS